MKKKKLIHLFTIVALIAAVPAWAAQDPHQQPPTVVVPAKTASEAWQNAQKAYQALTAAASAKDAAQIHAEQERLAAYLQQLQDKAAETGNARLQGALNNAAAASLKVHEAGDANDFEKVASALKTLGVTMTLAEKQVGALGDAPVAAPASGHHGHDHEHSTVSTTDLKVVAPASMEAGKTAQTIVRLTTKEGKPLGPDDLQVAHTEKLHLLIVDENLTDYHHEHPAPSGTPGEYRFEFTPKHGGTYHVWADIVPIGTGRQEYARTEVKVQGTPATKSPALNEMAEVGGYRFRLSTANKKPLRVGEASTLMVNVTTTDDKPFAQLEPIMGAFAHMVGFPDKVDAVTHVHPTGKEPETEIERGGPELQFEIVPERSGFHKFYLQTQIGGKDVFAPFGLQIEEADPNKAPASAYTCPMHPEIKQSTPGRCPKCGMALVPADSVKKEEKGDDQS